MLNIKNCMIEYCGITRGSSAKIFYRHIHVRLVILWIAMINHRHLYSRAGMAVVLAGQVWDHNRSDYEVNRDLRICWHHFELGKAVFGALSCRGYYVVEIDRACFLPAQKSERLTADGLLQYFDHAVFYVSMIALP